MAQNAPQNSQTSENRTGPFGFDKIVAGILLMVFVLVIITGVFTYLRLNRIVTTVSTGIRPDEKLLLVKEIFNNLSDAENSVKSYSLTKNEEYLSRFYETVQETETGFEQLGSLVNEGDSMQPYIDSLDILVEKKFTILDNMLVIQDEYRVQQALNKVVESIEENRPADLAAVDTSSVQEDEKPGFFARIFKKKNRKEKDTVEQAFQEPPVTDIDQISQQVQQVRSSEMARENRLRDQEWLLIQQDKEVMDKIRGLLAQLERFERDTYSAQTLEAENNARQIRVIIAVFVIAASLLLIMAAYTIARYVRSNNRYRKALKQASDEARELARTKERFLANMSHEIRTPMNVISGFTNQLIQADMKQEQQEQLSMVKKSADHLLHILNDILDFSKLEAGKMKLLETPFDLTGLVNDTVLQFKSIANGKNTRLSAECDQQLPRYVKGDSVRLRQILFNLVGNSVKFTEGGVISIKASLHALDPEKVTVKFEVSDTGVGIPESDLEKIFEEFEQATGTSGSTSGGTGLGLTITKKLVDLHQGSIEIKSSPGKGTSVIIILPYTRWEGELPDEQQIPEEAGMIPKGLKILVADDEEFNRKLLRTILSKYGCEIHEAAGGKEALKLLKKENFDLLLSDNRMPDMGGKELCQQIRSLKDPEKAGMPVIAITAAVSREDQEEYQEAGMDGFIPKPFEEAELLRTILRFAEKKDHSREAKDGETENRQEEEKKGEPVYSLDELKKLSGDDPKFYTEMLELFLENTAKGLESLGEKFAVGDWKGMAELAHKMAAPCKHIKADRLYGLLKEIENNGFNSTGLDRMGELMESAREQFWLIRNDIENGDAGK